MLKPGRDPERHPRIDRAEHAAERRPEHEAEAEGRAQHSELAARCSAGVTSVT